MAEDILVVRFRIDSEGAITGSAEGSKAIDTLKQKTTEAGETAKKSKSDFDELGVGISKAFKIASVTAFVIQAVRSSETLTGAWKGAFSVIGASLDGLASIFFGSTSRMADFFERWVLSIKGGSLEVRKFFQELFGFDSTSTVNELNRISEAYKNVGVNAKAVADQQAAIEAAERVREQHRQTSAENEERRQRALREQWLASHQVQVDTNEANKNFANEFGTQMIASGNAVGHFAQTFQQKMAVATQFGRQFVTGLGQGFAQFFSNMVTGAKNSGDKLLAAVLNTIGQIMVQWGTMFLMTGIGMLFIPGLQANAAGAIAAGLALIAAGGVVQGLASNLGGGSERETEQFGGGTAGGGGGTPIGGEVETGQLQNQGPNVVLNFEVKGLNMVDKNEVNGLVQTYIVPALKDLVQENNVTLVQSGF